MMTIPSTSTAFTTSKLPQLWTPPLQVVILDFRPVEIIMKTPNRSYDTILFKTFFLTINLPMADSLQPASTAEAASVELQYSLHQRVRTQQHRSVIWGNPNRCGKMFYVCISLLNFSRDL